MRVAIQGNLALSALKPPGGWRVDFLAGDNELLRIALLHLREISDLVKASGRVPGCVIHVPLVRAKRRNKV